MPNDDMGDSKNVTNQMIDELAKKYGQSRKEVLENIKELIEKELEKEKK